MKQLNNFIIEKLKISSKSKINNYDSYYFTEIICEFLYQDIEDAEKNEYDIINNWVNQNNIKNLNILSTEIIIKNYYDFYEDHELYDLKKYYSSKKNIDLILDDKLYNAIDKNQELGEKVWNDKYGFTSIYISKNDNRLTYKTGPDKIHFIFYE